MPRPAATPETRGVRLLRVGEEVRHILAELLVRQQVHDEVLTAHAVSITEVRMSPDLRNATAFVRPLLGTAMDEVLQAMRTNTAFFQREVAKQLTLRYAPKLKFVADESQDQVIRIERLLADPRVRRDLEGEGDD